jgi:hypothetical protein
MPGNTEFDAITVRVLCHITSSIGSLDIFHSIFKSFPNVTLMPGLLIVLIGIPVYYLTNKNLTTSFIGYKPSSFDESSYLTGNENVNEEHNRIIPTGFFRMLFAMGVLGVLGFMFFYGSVFNYCRTLFFKKLNYFSAYGKALVFGCLLFSVVIFVDFFTYSHMYTFSTIYVFYFFILGQLAVYKPNNVLLFVPKNSDLIQTNYTSVTQH